MIFDRNARKFSAHGKLAWLAGLLLSLLMPLPQAALADARYAVLNQPAIAVREPAKVLMISITKAGNRLIAVGDHGTIIYSNDNGQTWRQAMVPVQATLTAVAFATPRVGWAAGDYGVILRTTDGGKSWVKQISGIKVNQLMLASAERFSSTNPSTPAAQLALRRAHIFMDAGPDKPFLSIIAKSPTSAEIFGAYRMAVATDDGGQSWTDISLHVGDPVSHNLYDATWIGNSLYIVGEAGTVLRSDNQGTNFELLPAAADTTLFGILDSGNGIILTYGVAGSAFTSNDSGLTWQRIDLPIESNLTAGLVLKSGAILLCTENGQVLLSNNHGISFKLLNFDLGTSIFDAIQAQNSSIVFVGSGGIRVIPLSSLK